MPSDKKKQENKRRIIFVTGMSGAGRSSALKILEDFGYEVFDNFPLSLIPSLTQEDGHEDADIAFGLDTRSRGFSPEAVLKCAKSLNDDVTILFLTCANMTLHKRFSETRRSHPLAKDRPVLDGIRQERNWLKPLMDAADFMLDTSGLSIHDLRRSLEVSVHPDLSKKQLAVTVLSFGFKNGVPRESDMVLDVRFLRNPHWNERLKPMTGKQKAVQNYVAKDDAFEPFMKHTEGMLKLLLPQYTDEGKYYFTLAVGCTGGQHRSVFIVEKLSKMIAELGYGVTTRHRELD